MDRDRVTGKDGPALSPAGFMPLFVRIASPERAARMARLAADPQKFFPGMPVAAYDTPGFKSHGYWRGSEWVNVSFFALKGLQQYGYTDTAEAMRSRLLNSIARDPTTIWEYYDSRHGTGAGAKAYGWSAAFTIAFILDWMSIATIAFAITLMSANLTLPGGVKLRNAGSACRRMICGRLPEGVYIGHF